MDQFVGEQKELQQRDFAEENNSINDQDKSETLELYRQTFKSKESERSNKIYLNRFCRDEGYTPERLLKLDQKQAENLLISFVNKGKKKGIKWGALHNYTAAVTKFYDTFDISLNSRRINKFMPEPVKARPKKDRPYSHEEIEKALSIANERLKAIILLLKSTGVRIAALVGMKYGDLEDTDKGDIYKITIYPRSTKSEYITYCDPECKKALDTYFEMRRGHGEVITNNSPVIREEYNKRIPGGAKRKARHVTSNTVRMMLIELFESAGIRKKPSLAKGEGEKYQHEVMICNGFRKFFTNELEEAELRTERRWLLEGHNLKANDPNYLRVTEKKLQQEYEKAIDGLTIDPANKLRRKVEMLEVESSQIDKMQYEIKRLWETLKSERELTKEHMNQKVIKTFKMKDIDKELETDL